MGGLNNILNIAQSGLMASQAAIDVTSNNIANINTPGYSAETTQLEPVDYIEVNGATQGLDSPPGGVTVAGVQRQYDSFLQSRIYQAQQGMSGWDASSTTLGQVEQAFNETGQTGLSTYFNNFVNDWQQVASDPSDTSGRTSLLSDAQALVTAVQEKQGAIQDAIKQANDSISGAVDTVNSIATQIAQLNGQIAGAQGEGSTGSLDNLLDERDNLMGQLSQSINFSYYTDKTGQVTIMSGMQNLVSGVRTNTLSASKDDSGDYQLYLSGANITPMVTGGSMGGLISARSQAETQGLAPLNRFTAALTQQVNMVQEQGYGLDGSTGTPFFSPLTLAASTNSGGASIAASVTNESQLTLDQYNISIDSGGNYNVHDVQTGQLVASGAFASGGAINFDGIKAVITGSPSVGDAFTVDPLANAVNNFQVAITNTGQVAAAATSAGAPGDNSNALSMVNMLNGGLVPGLGGQSFMSYYQGIVSATGNASATATDNQNFESNLLDQLNQQRASISSVSIDDESINLIKYQQTYQAAAKVVETAQQLYQTLMSM